MLSTLLFATVAQTGSVPADLCRHFERFKAAGVPDKPLRQALLFLADNRRRFARHDLLSIADYAQSSTAARFYILDLETGTVTKEKVSHGSGHQRGVKRGDPQHDGQLDRCKWRGDRRNMTRPGFFRTAELYRSRSHAKRRRVGGRAVWDWPFVDVERRFNGLRMDGLTPGVNDHARARGVVMHGAWYNDLRPIMGRSYGCPAFTSSRAPKVLPRIKGGSLYYGYAPQCADDQARIDAQVNGWASVCGR